MFNELLSALGTVGNVIDAPGSVVRGLLAGDTDRAFGGIMDPSQRVSGRGLLENWDVLGKKQEGDGFDFGDALGMGTDILTNPLTYIPVGGLAARAVRGIGQGAEAAIGGAGAALRGAGQAAEVAGETPISTLMNARRNFAMAKGVVPGRGADRVIGGSVADKVNAATKVTDELMSHPYQQTNGIFMPGENAGALYKNADNLASRHETIHGLINNAVNTGETQGLPMAVKIPAKLHQLAGNKPGVTGGFADLMEELAAQSLENRGMMNQVRGGAKFLFNPGETHDAYSAFLSERSPFVGALYGQLPKVPRYAGYGAVGLGTAAAGGGALAYANQER